MRRLAICLLAVLIAGLVFAEPAQAERMKKYFGDVTTLLVGTSAVYDTVGNLEVGKWKTISGTVWLDWTSGGSSGGGEIYFEGQTASTDGATDDWQRLYLISYGDSCNITNTLSIPATQAADILYGFTLVMPFGLGSESAAEGSDEVGLFMSDAQMIPYEKIRCIVADTNWNAVADVYGWYLLTPAD